MGKAVTMDRRGMAIGWYLAGWTQKTIASKLNITQPCVSNWIRRYKSDPNKNVPKVEGSAKIRKTKEGNCCQHCHSQKVHCQKPYTVSQPDSPKLSIIASSLSTEYQQNSSEGFETSITCPCQEAWIDSSYDG